MLERGAGQHSRQFGFETVVVGANNLGGHGPFDGFAICLGRVAAGTLDL